MSIALIRERLAAYGCTSTLEEDRAIREITQEVALAALARTDFFRHAAFRGGTCLRILHGLARFSEDLDFALQAADPTFRLESYLPVIRREMTAYGYDIEFVDRSRVDEAVRTAFLKDDSLGDLLQLQYRPTTGPSRMIRIKLEVDTNPPAGGSFETRYLDFPFPQATVAHDPPSLFAGKIHALLCRRYLKGRDWYDFIWYTARRTPVNYRLLAAALDQTGPWAGTAPDADRDWCLAALEAKIKSIDWSRARDDVRAFVRAADLPSLDVWGRDFFLAQANKLTTPSIQ
jgi:predicted nucleotidyltransferase component of viral defense system